MTNERLRDAMVAARLGVDDIGDRLGVNPKTVERWVGGRRPHRRYRWALAGLLGVREQALWPEPESAQATNWQAQELADAYGYRADVPPARWTEMLEGAERRIDLLGYALLFLFEANPRLAGLLAAKARGGCRVRIALVDPDCEAAWARDAEERLAGGLLARVAMSLRRLEPVLGQDRLEVRQHAAPAYNSIFRFDEEMFVTPHLYATPGYAAPLFHLRRTQPEGPFDRFAEHFDAVWADARPRPR